MPLIAEYLCANKIAADCRKTVGFNCDGAGHTAIDCIRPMYCCICKSGQHLARSCRFSWHRERDDRHEETPPLQHEPENKDFSDHPVNDEHLDQRLPEENSSQLDIDEDIADPPADPNTDDDQAEQSESDPNPATETEDSSD